MEEWMDDKLETPGEELAVACFKIIFHHLSGASEKDLTKI
jgi:hypothetical protein